MINKLQNIDRRIIYVVLLIALAIPLINPIGIPLQVNPSTSSIFDIIEALNPAEDVVLLAFDYSPGSAADMHPQAEAIVGHLTKRGIKWAAVAFWADGPMMADMIIDKLEAAGGTYGTDFANLGFMTGGENAIKAFGGDPFVIAQDTRGNATKSLPIMSGITTIKDFGYIIEFASGNPGYPEWIRQVVDPLGVKFAAGVVTVSAPQAIPFFQSGQLTGLLQGLRGAAEYEVLNGVPGAGASMMDASSLGHVVIIAFILIGNIAYFLGKKK